jgi:hypothetical protein
MVQAYQNRSQKAIQSSVLHIDERKMGMLNVPAIPKVIQNPQTKSSQEPVSQPSTFTCLSKK